MEYLAYLETLWAYFPYMLYTFVILTLLPKSYGKIRRFAAADYEANRNKYHRCYSPDQCCHDTVPKPKQRKAVTRVYPKRQSSTTTETVPSNSNVHIKRQVQPATIHTQTNVNQIAKMFESGTASKKINRVTPTILPPEIRTHFEAEVDDKQRSAQYSQLLQENIENSVNLLNQVAAADAEELLNWHSEPMPVMRRNRPAPPSTLTYAGTSTTPSTISPAASSAHSSPHSSPPGSPVLRNAPSLALNMKSSFEDIFAAIARNAENNESFKYAGCNTLSPVTSIDDILSQRRLSRPLSAYSISDLLNEENAGMDETYVENFLRTMNKT